MDILVFHVLFDYISCYICVITEYSQILHQFLLDKQLSSNYPPNYPYGCSKQCPVSQDVFVYQCSKH